MAFHSFSRRIRAPVSGMGSSSLRRLSFEFSQDRITSHLSKSSNSDAISPDNPISWYPGHIAKAERELAEYIKKVDVVIEVRDARIPRATTHPMVPQWVGGRPLLVVVLRTDQVAAAAVQDWKQYYESCSAHGEERPGVPVFFADGKSGAGVFAIKRHALKFGEAVNDRRRRHGIQPRPVRAAVIGFPNVGKSALINRLLGRRVAKSQNLPGVTRQLQWVRLGSEREDAGPRDQFMELLDSPGIIPAKQLSVDTALRLAMCNDIGQAAYDRVIVASALCDRINHVHRTHPRYINMDRIMERYKLPFSEMTGDEIVLTIAEKLCQGNAIGGADKLLSDFRGGALGRCSLEAPSWPQPDAPSEGNPGDKIKALKPMQPLFPGAPSSSPSGATPAGEFDGW